MLMTKATIFISYSRKDSKWKDLISSHLNVLGNVSVWSDEEIAPGGDWFPEIKKAMDQARVAVLVISTDSSTLPSSLGRRYHAC
jgi:hypothetical protein